MMVVGLDLALEKTGWAQIVADRKELTIKTGLIVSKPLPKSTLDYRRKRLAAIVAQVMQVASLAHVVGIEGPSFNSRFGHAHDRAGLWWLTANKLLERGFGVVEVPPTNRMKYATGKGQATKLAVTLAVERRYGDKITIDDDNEADAFVIACMLARKCGMPIEASLPQTHLAAMDKVPWPNYPELW